MSEMRSKDGALYASFMTFFKDQEGVSHDPVTAEVVDETVIRRLMVDVVRPLNLISSLAAKALSQATQDSCALIREKASERKVDEQHQSDQVIIRSMIGKNQK